MERTRLKSLVGKTFVGAALVGALVAGYGSSSYADHGDEPGCFKTPPPEAPHDDTGGPAVWFGRTFVTVDGDTSGVHVYGRVQEDPVFGSEHWFQAEVRRDGYTNVCTEPH